MSDYLNRLSIKTPCSANWDEMKGNDQVRFCQHCDLSVQDLSAMTPIQAMQLVMRSKGRLCLRIHRAPSGEVVTGGSYQKLHNLTRRASRLAAGAFTAVMSLSTAAYAQSTGIPNDDVPVVTQSEFLKQVGGYSWLTGIVTDVNGAVIPGAQVTVIDEQTNEVNIIQTNDAGEFRFWVGAEHTYTTSIEARGFQYKTTEHIAIQLGETRNDVKLEPAGARIMMGDVAMIEYKVPLVKAAFEDDLDKVDQLIRKGVDVNQADESGPRALDLAVSHGNLAMVRRLLEAGANPSAARADGYTILFWVGNDHTDELVPMLIAAGAQVNQANQEGETALMHAVYANDQRVIRTLVNAGAMVDAQKSDGNTALMRAAQNGYAESVKALLAAGASYFLRNADGWDALMLAKNGNHTEIVELLQAAGAVASSVEQPLQQQ